MTRLLILIFALLCLPAWGEEMALKAPAGFKYGINEVERYGHDCMCQDIDGEIYIVCPTAKESNQDGLDYGHGFRLPNESKRQEYIQICDDLLKLTHESLAISTEQAAYEAQIATAYCLRASLEPEAR